LSLEEFARLSQAAP